MIFWTPEINWTFRFSISLNARYEFAWAWMIGRVVSYLPSRSYFRSFGRSIVRIFRCICCRRFIKKRVASFLGLGRHFLGGKFDVNIRSEAVKSIFLIIPILHISGQLVRNFFRTFNIIQFTRLWMSCNCRIFLG